MKNKFSIYLVLLLLIATITSCSPDPKPNGDQVDNYYFVKVGNVALPVRVCGNIKSDIGIVFVHGGPGGTAQGERAFSYWKEIEKYYKVIYYDQRASGFTQGNVNTSEMSIENFSNDLDHIVDFTKQVAKVNKIFIHGISWGGALSTYYLLDTAHQRKLNGAIIECPAYDIVNGLQVLSRNWLLRRVDSMIAIPKNVDYWINCKNYYATRPVITNKEFNQHGTYLSQLNGVGYNVGNVQIGTVSLPKGELAVAINNAIFAPEHLTYEGQSVFTHLDLTSKLNQIKLPIMLVWGDKDGLLPRNNLAQKYVSNLGSTDITYDATKYLLSAHLPHAEEWQQFNVDAKSFIEAHK
jgi:pimeloyl-ACP methyl ester carboxylesterase